MGTFETHIDKTNDLTIIVFIGTITTDDIFAAAQKYLTDKPTSKVLWNYMEADGANITSEDLQTLLTKISKLPNTQKTKKIAVAVSRYIGHVISHLTSIYIGNAGIGADYRIFRSIPEAMEWLEIWKSKE
jgi:hypothetical protein